MTLVGNGDGGQEIHSNDISANKTTCHIYKKWGIIRAFTIYFDNKNTTISLVTSELSTFTHNTF